VVPSGVAPGTSATDSPRESGLVAGVASAATGSDAAAGIAGAAASDAKEDAAIVSNVADGLGGGSVTGEAEGIPSAVWRIA
jgi:hypothetical protein